MQPLSLANEPDLEDIVQISGAGIISSVENDPPSFFIHATQYVDGGYRSDDVALLLSSR